MAFPVSFRPLAQDDVDDALSWYGQERPALALGFAESLDAVITRISETPLQFPAVHRQVRRALLGRFPYGVFFTVVADRIHGRFKARFFAGLGFGPENWRELSEGLLRIAHEEGVQSEH